MSITRSGFASAILLLAAFTVSAQPVEVTHHDGLLSIRCTNAPLSTLFESIEKEAGIELVLEDEIKSKRLTADLTDVPVAMAVSRLLEGVGVNYIVMMDPSDWGRVDKIFVGAGGGGPARSAGLPRGPVAPEPPEEVYEEPYDPSMEAGMEPGMEGAGMEGMDPLAMEDPSMMENVEGDDMMPDPPDELDDSMDPQALPPPGSSPVPDFLPPAQSFPRSNFTPGLPSNRFQGGAAQPQAQPEEAPAEPPPAMFPFTDAYGRPIPIPPGMNPQQQQRQQRQQQRQQ